MLSRLTLAVISAFVIGVAAQESEQQTTYGDVKVGKVLRLDEHIRIYCDIPELPPIVGRDIPVCINGLAPAANPKDNLKLLMFLNDLLLSKTDAPEKIVLKDIQRGSEFCLVADIKVDGKDLCEMLIEKKLAKKVIRVRASKADPSSPQSPADSAPGAGIETGEYIASRSSKVYHRSTCSHARRMNRSKAVAFSSKSDAEATGRRPCKTCKP